MTTRASPAFSVGPRVRTADGVEIATYDLGGTGPPLLLCHATGFHGLVWLPVAAHLVNDFHCIAFDFRGHGRSDKAPRGDYRWAGFARDTLAVIEGTGLERPRAVGHSAGGAVLLLTEEARPGTLRSMYCYEPVVPPEGANPAPSRSNAMADGTRRRREVFASRDEAFANYVAKPPFSTFDPDAVHAYVDYGFEDLPDGTVRLLCRKDDEARVYEMALHHTAFERLAEVTPPVTIVCGADLPHFGPEATEPMAERLALSRTEILSDLGHFGPMERPAEVAGSIRGAFSAMDDMAPADRATPTP